MKYTVIHRCGHESTVKLFGANKEREWRLKCLAEDLCPECAEKERIEEYKKESVQSSQKGYPLLAGSEKQVMWATGLRVSMVIALEKIRLHVPSSELAEYEKVLAYIAGTKTSAHWWIDNRTTSPSAILRQARQEMLETQEAKQAEIPPEVIEETVMRPEEVKTETIAEIVVKSDEVQVVFPERREDFRLLMRGHDFKWAGRWILPITSKTGTAFDRAAEIGNALLNAGFIVSIMDVDIRNAAINATFVPVAVGWISKAINKKAFAISWDKKHNLYSEIMKIPGAKYEEGQIMVPIENYQDVNDFAIRNSFSLTEEARECLKMAEETKNNMYVVIAPPPEVKVVNNKIPKLKPEEAEIDESLRDKD